MIEVTTIFQMMLILYQVQRIQGSGKWYQDGVGHGTHIAVTISAKGQSNQGVVGISRHGKLNLHIVKVFDNFGNWAWVPSLIAAVDTCVDEGEEQLLIFSFE